MLSKECKNCEADLGDKCYFFSLPKDQAAIKCEEEYPQKIVDRTIQTLTKSREMVYNMGVWK